jgi:PQQ-like domain
MRRAVIGGLGTVVSASALLAAGLAGGCGSTTGNTGGTGGTTTSSTGTTTSGTTGTTSGTTTSGTTTSSSSSSSGTAMPGDSVLTHHKNPTRDGVYIEAALTKAAVTAGLDKDASFSASLPDPNDAVYAQPLFIDGGTTGPDLVIVVTEANNAYALDAATGAVAWTTNVGTPVPLSMMSCGNIDPFGVTGTPVIDFASRTLFFDALVLAGGKPTHEIFALSIDTGAQVSGWPVVVNKVAKSGGVSFTDTQQGERGAPLVVNGTLYVPFGGLYGDCNPYHGWVVAVSIADPTKVQSWATALQGGGIWSPGGLSTDGTYLYASTGNTFNAQKVNGTFVWGGGDAFLRFGTGAAFAGGPAYFAPTNWPNLDNGDLDMGTAPVIFDLPGSTPSHLAIMFGKDGNAYLLDPANPGSVGGALGATGSNYFTLHVASNEIISAPVVYTTATATYISVKGNGSLCTSGQGGDLTTLKVVPGSPPSLAGSWCATTGIGSPMVTTSDGHGDAIVWSTGAEGDGHLHGFDGDTGAAIAFPGSNVNIPNMRRYNTPIAAKGRIFVAADNAVVAFKP